MTVRKPFKIAIILFSLFMVIGILSALTGSSKSTGSEKEKETTPENTTPQESDNAKDYSKLPYNERVDYYIESIKRVLDKNSDNFQYEIVKSSEKVILINVWSDGTADEVALAMSGNTDKKAEWDFLRTSFQSTSQKFSEGKKAFNLGDDLYVTLNIVNDQNPDNMLLSFVDGTLIYDILDQ